MSTTELLDFKPLQRRFETLEGSLGNLGKQLDELAEKIKGLTEIAASQNAKNTNAIVDGRVQNNNIGGSLK